MKEKAEPQASQDSLAFIVRIWRSGGNGRWRFSVQDVATGERQGFANLEVLFAYFRQHVDEATSSTRGPPGGEVGN